MFLASISKLKSLIFHLFFKKLPFSAYPGFNLNVKSAIFPITTSEAAGTALVKKPGSVFTSTYDETVRKITVSNFFSLFGKIENLVYALMYYVKQTVGDGFFVLRGLFVIFAADALIIDDEPL